MPDKNDKTKAEETAAKQKQLYEAVNLIANHYQEAGRMVFLVSSEGMLIAAGQKWELAGVLEYYAEYFKGQTHDFVAKRDENQMKMVDAMQKAKAEADKKKADAQPVVGELPVTQLPEANPAEIPAAPVSEGAIPEPTKA